MLDSFPNLCIAYGIILTMFVVVALICIIFFFKIEISYILYIKLTMLQERVSMIVILLTK